MPTPCPRCGAPRSADSSDGPCSNCSAADATDDDVTYSYSPGERGRLSQTPTETLGTLPRVLLLDTRDGRVELPLVRPSSSEMPHEGVRSSRIQLIGEIARGGMGAILKGRDPDLGRDLAVKVLLESHRDNPDLARRFVEEAQIGGQLQHPGIVPVYELGTFGDSRPYFTMKLVKGRTLSDLMASRENPLDDFARFIGIFEQIAQTVAYAHARGVIHRDLKPSNVMVGSFGEVQVMDWGLAKVLPRGGVSDDAQAGKEPVQQTVIATARSGSDDSDLSRAGSIMGTPSYMAPEQARGEVARVDERADVFALGSILCEILTGKPAFLGRNSGEIQRKAALGDTADALDRLDACGADLELIGLARHCLARELEDRPGNAGVLAGRITTYQAEVQQKLHEAERDRAVAEATTVEERKRRKLQVGLAASILVIAALGGLAFVYQTRQGHARATARAKILADATTLLKLAQADPEDPSGWQAALVSVRQAEGAIGNADPEALREFEKLRVVIVAGAETAERDRILLDRLVDIRSAKADDLQGTGTEMAYAGAFRQAGLDMATPLSEAKAAEIKARSASVALAIASGLDDWANLRRGILHDSEGARRLTEAAMRLDPDPWREDLRSALDQPDPAKRREALRALAESAKFDELGPISLELLGAALSQAGDPTSAESVLRAAQRRYPGDVWVCYDLAQVLDFLNRPDEAIRYYMAARSIRPETAHELGHALERKGELDEAIAVFRDLARRRPKNGRHLGCLGRLLKEAGRTEEAAHCLDEAVAALREAIRIEPGDDTARANLGRFLMSDGKLDEAVAVLREAIRLRPDFAHSRRFLTVALGDQGKHDEALVEAREAVRLEPDAAESRITLGNAFQNLGKPAEAATEAREAIRLKPNLAVGYTNLGNALRQLGQINESLAAFRESIRLQPDLPNAHTGIGLILAARGESQQAAASFLRAIRITPDFVPAHDNLVAVLIGSAGADEFIAQYREAMRLKPDFYLFHHNLGNLLGERGKFDEAIPEWREAIRLDPDIAEVHAQFGAALCFVGRYDEAEVELRRALQLKPEDGRPHFHLGHIFHVRGRLDEAVAEYREAIRLLADVPEFPYSLGVTLEAQGKRDEAIAAYREAIRLRPAYAEAHGNLGTLLEAVGKHEEALTEFREALRLKPDLSLTLAELIDALVKLDRYDEAVAACREAIRVYPLEPRFHFKLGWIFEGGGDLDEAIAAYRETIRLDSDYAEAHCNLAACLGKQGDYAGSLAEYRRGHEIGSKRPDWSYPSADWVRNAEVWADTAARLPAILKGEGKPRDAAHGVAFALHCYARGLYATSARLFEVAFADDPKLVDDLKLANRYNAACAAALAGSGLGEDDPAPDHPARASLRRQARDWLKADLAAWAKILESGPAETRAAIVPTLQHWREDSDLAGIRDPEAVAKLPEEEREAYRSFWEGVDALRKKAEPPRP